MNCGNCGMQLNPEERFCPACGTPVQQQSQQTTGYYQPNVGRSCPDCGTEIYDSDVFCPTCGKSVKENPVSYSPAPAPAKKPVGALIVAICLGVVAIVAALVIAGVVISKNYNDDNSEEYVEEVPTPTPPPPEFTGVSATSTRDYDIDGTNNEVVYYYPSYAVDGDMYTAWSSDRAIELTPTITLTANEKQYVTGVRMTNGYCKSQRTYEKNRRITKAKIMYEGGEKIVDFGINNFGNMIEIYLDEPVYTDYVSIKVLENYYGPWLDIAISEIEVF